MPDDLTPRPDEHAELDWDDVDENDAVDDQPSWTARPRDPDPREPAPHEADPSERNPAPGVPGTPAPHAAESGAGTRTLGRESQTRPVQHPYAPKPPTRQETTMNEKQARAAIKKEDKARAAQGAERRARMTNTSGAKLKLMDFWDRLLDMRPVQRYVVLAGMGLTAIGVPAGLYFALAPKPGVTSFAVVQIEAYRRVSNAHDVIWAPAGTDLVARACPLNVKTDVAHLYLRPLKADGTLMSVPNMPEGGWKFVMDEPSKNKEQDCVDKRFITPGMSGEVAVSDTPGRLNVLRRIRASAGPGMSGPDLQWVVTSPTHQGVGQKQKFGGEFIIAGGVIKLRGDDGLKIPAKVRAGTREVINTPAITLPDYWSIPVNAQGALGGTTGAVDTLFVASNPRLQGVKFELSADSKELWAQHPDACNDTDGQLIDIATDKSGSLRLLRAAPIRFKATAAKDSTGCTIGGYSPLLIPEPEVPEGQAP